MRKLSTRGFRPSPDSYLMHHTRVLLVVARVRVRLVICILASIIIIIIMHTSYSILLESTLVLYTVHIVLASYV